MFDALKAALGRPAAGARPAKRVLNVGGGSKGVELPPHFQDWRQLRLDIDARVGADLVCDARELRECSAAESFDAVYCSHNLEHYYRHDVDKVLRGFLHVLKPGGFAEIRVPDIGALIKLLANNDLDIEQEIYKANVGAITAHDMFYGYAPEIEASGQDFYAHKTGFSRDSLLRALRTNGFAEIYFAPPLALLELHVFAFKQPADAAARSALGLGEPAPIEARHEAVLPSRSPVHAAAAVRTDPVEALYQRAAAAYGAERWDEAAALAREALALDPALPALHYLQGCCQLEQERHAAALESFARCLELGPKYPLSVEARVRQALCRARSEAAQGDVATLAALAPLPHEIVAIGDARSLAEGYNRALALAQHDIVLFAHDDVEIASPDFAARLLRALGRHDLVGVAGTRRLVGAAWHFAGYPHLAGQVGMPAADGGYVVTLYDVGEPESKGLQALDGLLLATRRDAALRLGFDAAAFDGWHLYDLDFSLRAAQAGLDCASCNDLLVVHASQGSYDEHWLKYAQRFLDKHRGLLGPQQSVFYKPELVSLPLRSAGEWRLLTQHLIGA